MELFSNKSCDPKHNAQRNLEGRTHYVDDDTLRFHKSRIISSRHTDEGLLFAIVTSDSLDFENSRRGFRYVVFDLFGKVLARTELDQAFKRSEQATKAMWDAVNAIDAKAVTRTAMAKHLERVNQELAELEAKLEKIS